MKPAEEVAQAREHVPDGARVFGVDLIEWAVGRAGSDVKRARRGREVDLRELDLGELHQTTCAERREGALLALDEGRVGSLELEDAVLAVAREFQKVWVGLVGGDPGVASNLSEELLGKCVDHGPEFGLAGYVTGTSNGRRSCALRRRCRTGSLRLRRAMRRHRYLDGCGVRKRRSAAD
jgi:hypothetical protein